MKYNNLLIIFFLILIANACVTLKSEDVTIKTGSLDLDSKSSQVVNFKLKNISNKKGVYEGALLYSFDQKRVIHRKDFYTDLWDIQIILEYDSVSGGRWSENVTVGLNNKYAASFFKGEVLGVLLNQKFDEVLQAPNPEDSIYNRVYTNDGRLLGDVLSDFYNVSYYKDYFMNTIAGAGVYAYDNTPQSLSNASQIIFSVNKRHKIIRFFDGEEVEWSKHLVSLLPNRTFVFRTTKGNFVKFQLQAVHKDKPEPVTLDSEFGYLTFRYFIQKNGNRSLFSK